MTEKQLEILERFSEVHDPTGKLKQESDREAADEAAEEALLAELGMTKSEVVAAMVQDNENNNE